MKAKPPPLDALRALRPLLVSAHKGIQALVDTEPRCPACGKVLGEYFGVPWSIRCANCRTQASRGLPSE